MFSLYDVLGSTAPVVRIVDVGAMDAGEAAPYAPLLRRAELLGFEPQKDECAKLNAAAAPGQWFLPLAIGDGGRHVFRQCAAGMTSSLLEPDSGFANLFQGLSEPMRVMDRTEIQTARLDDVPEAHGADMLKIDVQGAERLVFEGASRTLASCLVVHTEVELVPLYEGQPLFAEVDQCLRAAGFLLHKLASVGGRVFKPLLLSGDPNRGLSQWLWADAVYVRDVRAFDALTPDALLKLSLILHEAYRSFDLAAVALERHDRATGSAWSPAYLERLTVR